MFKEALYSNFIKLSCLTLLIVFATSAIGCSFISTPKVAPEFTIDLYETIDYKQNDFFSIGNSEGNPTFINFWFPSCPPCVAEMPEIDNFYLENKKDVEVVAIQLLGLDSINEGQNFVREKNIHFAVGADKTGKISVDYQISVYPTTVFVDAQGNIEDYWQGQINIEELNRQLMNFHGKRN